MRGLILLGLLIAVQPLATNATVLSDETELFQGFALSQCLARAYPDNPVAVDARASAGGYLEFGSLPIEAYEEAVALADKALAQPYGSKDGKPLQAMKCIDFAFGAELQALIARYAAQLKGTAKAN